MKDITGAKILYWLVKGLQKRHYSTTINKLVKLMYIFERLSGEDLDYELRYNGPHSSRVIYFIHIGKHLGWLEDHWKKEMGLFLTTKEADVDLDEKDKQIIQELIDRYGTFSTNELNVITTALFLKTVYNASEEDIIYYIYSLNPKRDLEQITKLVIRAESGAKNEIKSFPLEKGAIILNYRFINKELFKILRLFDVSVNDIVYIALVPMECEKEYEDLFEEGTPFATRYVEKFNPMEYNGARYIMFVGYRS